MIFLGVNLLVFLINLLLFLYAKKIVSFFNDGEENATKTNVFKLFNILFFIFHLLDLIFSNYADDFINVGYSLITIYVGFLAFEVFAYFNRKKFGNKKTSGNGKVTYEDNYNSRINNVIVFTILFIVIIIAILKIWHMESSLQQTGFIGIILAFLALTSSHWLPNIISGLTLMNSNHITKGDIIRFDNTLYSVFDIGFFYTHLLDIKHNARVLIENALLSKKQITNLSKKASLEGFRDSIVYNIGYPPAGSEKAYDNYINSFESIFKEIFEEIEGNESFKLNFKSGYDLFMIEAADYALRYEFSFYYTPIKVSTTANIRKFFSTRNRLNALVQKKAHIKGISLSTPLLIRHSDEELPIQCTETEHSTLSPADLSGPSRETQREDTPTAR
jgi:hypothetical protein